MLRGKHKNTTYKTMETSYMTNQHYLTTEDKKHLSSRGVGGTALGLGIAGTALGLLNSGNGILGNIFGNNASAASNVVSASAENQQYLERKQTADYIQITKDYYENKLASLRELTESFYTLDQKIQAAKDAASIESRTNFDSLNKRLIELEKSDAVQKATQPLYNEINSLKLNFVNTQAQNGIAAANVHTDNMVHGLDMKTTSEIAFESERRRCGDNTIVNYVNSTFYPRLTAGLQTTYTSTFQPIYNPLMPPPPLV